MILARILDYLSAHQAAGIGELAGAVGSTPDAVRSMLDTLQRRGLVHPVRPGSACGTSCRQCSQPGTEIYAPGPAPEPGVATTPCQPISWR
jgi:hypothetical protein